MARMVKVAIDAAKETVTWSFPGTTLEALVLDATRASEANRRYAMLHGFNQRCGDNAADDKTVEGKRDSIATMIAFYEAGGEAWERERSAMAPRVYDIGAVVAALARVKMAGDVDKANSTIDRLADKKGISRVEAAKLFAGDEAIAVEMARAKAAKTPPAVNADALLAEMGGE